IIIICALWDEYKESLSEDILRVQRRANPGLDLNFTDVIFNRALLMLEERCISINSKTLLELGVSAALGPDFDVMDRDILQEKKL
ncbi:hypothetical protein PRIEUP_LOCUS1385, partial [Pristimantis euphronides]